MAGGRGAPTLTCCSFPEMQAYFLQRHAYLCQASGDFILLDLRRNRYLAVPRRTAHCLSRVVVGWPRRWVCGNDTTSDSTEVESSIHQLLCSELLTADARIGKRADPVRAACARSSLRERSDCGTNKAPTRLGTTALALFVSAIALRVVPLQTIVKAARAGQRRADRFGIDDSRSALETAVRAFDAARPWFLTSRNRCMLESLALLTFLRWRGFHPQWIFGVRAAPFAAHCWLQWQDIVLNDTVEHVSTFTPIMIV
jgi:hypothetical protein